MTIINHRAPEGAPSSRSRAKASKTVQLTNTVNTIEARLDPATDLTLRWATEKACQLLSAEAGHPLRFAAGGVIRRALEVYAEHLGKADVEKEARALRDSANAKHYISRSDREESLVTLGKVQAGEADLPPLKKLLHPHPVIKDFDAFNARVEELLAPSGNRRGSK